MEHSARLFSCVHCNAQAIICSPCDRNNIYCSDECSRTARAASCRAAAIRYANSRRGRHQHAKRQKQYRERQKNKVTHHTSPVSPLHDELHTRSNEEMVNPVCGVIRCHFCEKRCSPFLRLDFMTRKEHQRKQSTPIWT